MKILLDHNVNRRFRAHLPGHEVSTTREMRWELLSNGILLKTAADGHFDAFLTIDKNIEFEQNLKALPLLVIVIDARTSTLESLIPFAGPLLILFATRLDLALYVQSESGHAVRLTSPRLAPPGPLA